MDSSLTRRDFNKLLGGGLVSTAMGAATWPAWAGEAVDVPWRLDNPHLSGNFLPVQRETVAEDLPVVSGRIPPELRGVYMRNGPNPLFKPIAFAYPMDGDGMIHAVYLDAGRARYRNRFVRTNDLLVEQRAGHAVYGSFTHPAAIDPSLLRPGDNPGPFIRQGGAPRLRQPDRWRRRLRATPRRDAGGRRLCRGLRPRPAAPVQQFRAAGCAPARRAAGRRDPDAATRAAGAARQLDGAGLIPRERRGSHVTNLIARIAYRREPPRGRGLPARGGVSAVADSASMPRQMSMNARAAGARVRPRR